MDVLHEIFFKDKIMEIFLIIRIPFGKEINYARH